MAEELQPKGLKEGAADPHAPTSKSRTRLYPTQHLPPHLQATNTPTSPGTAEDRKAALALSSLDAPPDDTNNTSKGATAEAATDAMKQLSVSSTALDTPKEEKKAVKVQGKDVELLVRPHSGTGRGWKAIPRQG
jgi:hypothetical protein